MLRSTKKAVKEKIRAYILDNLEFCGYVGNDGFPEKEPQTWEGKILLCRDIFRDEYVNPQNLRRYGGEWGCFREWLCGLPSALTVDFSHYDARQLVREWLDQTEDETNKYDDAHVWDKYLHLITREFFAMVEAAEKQNEKEVLTCMYKN